MVLTNSGVALSLPNSTRSTRSTRLKMSCCSVMRHRHNKFPLSGAELSAAVRGRAPAQNRFVNIRGSRRRRCKIMALRATTKLGRSANRSRDCLRRAASPLEVRKRPSRDVSRRRQHYVLSPHAKTRSRFAVHENACFAGFTNRLGRAPRHTATRYAIP